MDNNNNNNNNNNNGFSSPRAHEVFPAGLRVLVVDDDPTWLKILEKMLKKCSYEVTTCCLAREALDLLRERKDGFDIVISDVNMPDMDGFKLLEHVGLEMDLPVIMMSVDGETSRVMKGVQHGACDYLLKPIRMKELKNIWQHVFRKKIHEVRDIEGHEGIEEIQMMRNGISDQSDDGYFFCGGDLNLGKKRKDFENKHDNKDFGDSSAVKKTRVVWTVDLHQKFVKAVNHIGFDKVGPKKILDLMNVQWLTRENVASHLQKYRLYLSRLQKENDVKTSFGGIKHSDLSSKEQAGNIGFQNISMKQNDPDNSNYGIPGNIVIQNTNSKIYEGSLKGIGSLPMSEPKIAVIGDTHETHKASSSGMGLPHTFGSLEPDAKYSAFSSLIPPQYSWSREVSDVQFKQEHSPRLELKNGFNHLSLPDLQNQIQVNNLQPTPSIYPTPFNKERDKRTQIKIKPSFATKCSNEYIQQQTTRGNAFDLCPVQTESHSANCHPSEPITRSTYSMKNQVIDQILVNDVDSVQGNLILGRGSPFAPLNVDLHTGLLQEDSSQINLQLQNKEFLPDCNNTELIGEVPIYLYDALRFDYEYPYPCESMDYPVMDQGLFIV